MAKRHIYRLSRYNKQPEDPKKQLAISYVVGYVRVSTDGQEDNTSLLVQREAIENFALAKGYQLTQVYSDVASGSSFSRDGFEKLQAHLLDAANGIDALIIYKLDRLSRSVVDGYSFIQKLSDRKISTVSITENIDNSTPSGQALLQLIFTFAEMERKVITERMVSGRKQKLKSGDKPAGSILGYTYDENKKLKVIGREADTVYHIFDLYRRHGSLSKVKAELDSKKIFTKRGKKFSRQSLHYILTNVFYTGLLVGNGQVLSGNHPAIIPDDRFQQVQDMLLARRKSSVAP